MIFFVKAYIRKKRLRWRVEE